MIPQLNEHSALQWSEALNEQLPDFHLHAEDLVVKVTTSGDHPAWYRPSTRTVHLNSAALDMSDTDVVNGALLHELSHACHSPTLWEPGMSEAALHVATVLEEIRIEHLAIRTAPARAVDPVRTRLRAMFRWVLPRITERDPETDLDMSCLWALVVGRTVAGVATTMETIDIDTLVRHELGDRTVKVMARIVDSMLDGDLSATEAAAKWLAEVGEPDPETGIGFFAGLLACSTGEHTADADHHPKSDGRSKRPEVRKALRRTRRNLEIRSVRLADPTTELRNALTRYRTGDHYPGAHERRLALSVAEALQSMYLPAVVPDRVRSEAPPGRLDSREALRRSVDRSQGRMTDTRPWKSRRHKREPHRPLVIGTMVDTSGSMMWAETLSASLSWVMSTAGRSVGARTGAVAYGDDVIPTVLPGRRLPAYRIVKASGRTEHFDVAAAALDAMLGLTVKRTSRLVVNFSDGDYVIPSERHRSEEWVRRWARAGVTVLWVGCSSMSRRVYEDRCGSMVRFVDYDLADGTIDDLVETVIGAIDVTT